jgi:chromosome segregation ATPase
LVTGVPCTTDKTFGAKCEPCRIPRNQYCSQFNEYLIDYAVQRLDLSESRARDLFLDYGTRGLKRHELKKASKPDPESESDHDSDAAEDLEVKVMVQKTVQLRVQVKTLEQRARDLRLENHECKKEISDLLEECENLKRDRESAEYWHKKYEEENQDLRAEKAHVAMKKQELSHELHRVQVDHSRYIKETEKEKQMLGRENRAVEGKLSAEVKKKEAELTALRMENEGLQKTFDEISALREELNGQRSKSFVDYAH